MMKHYLYHVTKPENIPAIMREGIKRKYGFAVYLSENWDSWWKPGLAVLRVRITGLNKACDMGKLDENLDEILVFCDINPERVSRWHPPKGELKRATERYNNNFVRSQK